MGINKVIYGGNTLVDLSGDPVKPENVEEGVAFHDAAGEQRLGSMPDHGAVNAEIDGLTVTSYTIPAGKHSGGGKVTLTNDIETALAAI